MPFRPNVHDELTLNGVTYRIAEHPAAPGIPYGQEGRAGIVYQLLPSPTGRGAGDEGAMALKVFRARFRTPALVSQAEKLAAFADLPGLTVCRRTVLTPTRYADLLRREPDLTYAVLMPWIEGPTWTEVMLEKRPLTPQQALDLARAFADILSRMEQNGIAHCDLSGPNVLLPMLAQQTAYRPPSTVELVDVEGLYAPGLPRPEALPSGSSGYAHRTAREGLWGPTADRFAGAVLLAEMLCWGDESVRQACYGETYFDPAEMPAQGSANPPRYQTLLSALARHYGQPVADLFERAWTSETLADCPTFGEWLVALPEHPVAQAFSLSTAATETAEAQASTSPEEVTLGVVRGLMQAARRMEDKGNLDSALELYRQALELAQADPSLRSLAREIELTVQDVEKRMAAQASPLQPAISPRPVEEGPGGRVISPLSLGEGPGVRAKPRRKPGWGFWLLWVFANAGGGIAGSVASFAVSITVGIVAALILALVGMSTGENAFVNSVLSSVMLTTVFLAAFGTVLGAAIGFTQWLMLRQHVHKAGWWVPASAVGWIIWCLGIVIATALTQSNGTASEVRLANDIIVIATGAIGLTVGVSQWIVLRRRVRSSGWWILASIVGWAIIGYLLATQGVTIVSGDHLDPGEVNITTGLLVLVSGIAGANAMSSTITGAVLVWLLRQPRCEDERKSQPE
jgi:hypothetical protein